MQCYMCVLQMHLWQLWVQEILWHPLWDAVLLLLTHNIGLEGEREGAALAERDFGTHFEVWCQAPV
jgi:hypothetical protein